MKLYHRATIISGILGLVLILAVYIMLTSVNLVFMKDNEEIYRMEDVGIFSNLDVESEDVGGDYDFTYDTGKKTKDFENSLGFRFEIGKTILLNLVTFKWGPQNYDIVLDAN